ncbi:hypothetical protein TCDM_12518 [Trypanosoma cruzi Dm28c]|uniref:Uncharacterized protein n=1 Tax=Trypanosoma cruzi Dm28c TaxID=1416333 RepID=V5AL51_TRYCR|nr:hypothetical protein TCDM_12518 [Trypanosoma cruzi Dm28c]
MTTALCASPAARVRRGRDERRAEGAVTCGRATRACGAEHTFLPSCFSFFMRPGWADTRSATHTATPCRSLKEFFFALRVHFTRRHFFWGLSCEHFFYPDFFFSALTLPME